MSSDSKKPETPAIQVYAPPAQERTEKADDRVLALSVTITLALLIIIGLPLGAILPPRYVQKLPINILVPLYIVPSSGAWEKLYDTVIRHPELNFTVVVDPSPGLGTPPYPGAEYVKAITKLNVYPNVRTIGYINTARGTRGNAIVNQEIGTYAAWSEHPGLGLDGIFFDQTPTEDSLQSCAYLRNISATVKHSIKFREPRLVVLNPGTVSDANLTNPYADITVVFEGAYMDMPTHDETKSRLTRRRENIAYLINSVPDDFGKGRLRKVINEARKDVEWLFITSRSEDMYSDFSSIWDEFLDLLW